MKLHAYVSSDLIRYAGHSDWRSFIKIFISVPGFRYSVVLRTTRWLQNRSRGWLLFYVICRLVLLRQSYRYGFQVPAATEIGQGLYLGHFGPIIVNHRAIIGSNVNLAPGTLIGQENRGARKGTPIIGDGVWIGTNAIVVGNIRIGDNALIAPGAYVNFDVPESGIVLGNPGKIVSNRGTGHYIENRVQTKKVSDHA